VNEERSSLLEARASNAVVLLTPEQIKFVIYAMQDYGTTHTTARHVEGEMWRAQMELKIAASKDTSDV
jgi:hypothetical protein